ncbi:beta-1,3-galactosyltransferase 5-like [Clavelina lepadiformis]|uniref:beta-1,3-galactosyltransferase 5-like n=1 Tax=Clavelina lepadiformis TaxID=159417 RepID=UPI00404172F1
MQISIKWNFFVISFAFVASLLFINAIVSKQRESGCGKMMSKDTKNTWEEKILGTNFITNKIRIRDILTILPNPDPILNNIKPNRGILMLNASVAKRYMTRRKDFAVLRDQQKVDPTTSKAIKLIENLDEAWNLPDFFFAPDREKFGSGDNDGCYRPPKRREKWGMIIVVKSDVVNVDVRNAIRESWGSVSKIDEVSLEVVFLLAKAHSEQIQSKISTESDQYGDILQINLKKSTGIYPDRSIAGMHWAVKHFPPNYLFTTVDENIAVNLGTVVEYLSYHVRQMPEVDGRGCMTSNIFPFLCGLSFRQHDIVSRDPKYPWSLSPELYPPEFLPPHCQGAFYSTSVSTCQLIVDAAMTSVRIPNDAVWITGILRQKLGLGPNTITGENVMVEDGDVPMLSALSGEVPKQIRFHWKMHRPGLKLRKVLIRFR